MTTTKQETTEHVTTPTKGKSVKSVTDGLTVPQGKGKPALVIPQDRVTEARKDVRAALAAQAAADAKYGEAGRLYAAALVAVGAITSDGTWDHGFTVPILALAKGLTPNPKGYAYPSGGAKSDTMPQAERDYIDAVQRVNTGLTRAAAKAKGTEGQGKGTGTGTKSGKGRSNGGGQAVKPVPMPPATVATIGRVIDTVAAKGTKAATDRMAKSVAAWLSNMATTRTVGNMSADAAALLLAACRAYVESSTPKIINQGDRLTARDHLIPA